MALIPLVSRLVSKLNSLAWLEACGGVAVTKREHNISKYMLLHDLLNKELCVLQALSLR